MCEPCEGVKVKKRPAPNMPSKAEREEHEITHCPYRSWCDVCVKAMGREEPHRRVTEDQETSLPTIGMDYDKYGEEEAVSQQVTTLVLKDSETGMLKGHVTEVKGPRDEWIVKRCCKDIEGLGHSNILLKTDGEPALVAVQSEVKRSHRKGCARHQWKTPTYQDRS